MKMEVHASSQSYFTVRKLTTTALLGAIAVVLSFTPIGYIYLGLVRVTFMHIPVIIAAIIEGPAAGAVVGLIFGVSSLVTNLGGPMGPVFINPLVSIFPRILIGIIAALVYKVLQRAATALITHRPGGKTVKLLQKVCSISAVPLAAAAGTITNTVGVLGMIYLVAAPQFIRIKGITMGNLGKVLLGVASLNGPLEVIAAVILVTAIVKGLNKVRK
jgi:uncharacterized membrane protein